MLTWYKVMSFSDNWLVKVTTGDLSGAELRMGWVIERVGANPSTIIVPTTVNANGEFVLAENSSAFITDTGAVNTSIDMTERNQSYVVSINFYGTASSILSKDVNIQLFSRGNNASGGVDILAKFEESELDSEVSNMLYNFRFDPSLLSGVTLSSPYNGLSSSTLISNNAMAVPTLGNPDSTGGDNAVAIVSANQNFIDFDDKTNVIGGDTTIDFYLKWTDLSVAFVRVFQFDTASDTNCIEMLRGTNIQDNFVYEVRDAATVTIGLVVLENFFTLNVAARVTINHFATPLIHVYKDGVLFFDGTALTAAAITAGVVLGGSINTGAIPSIVRTRMNIGHSNDGGQYSDIEINNLKVLNSIEVP